MCARLICGMDILARKNRTCYKTRGSVLVCALPWLSSLFHQHVSSIASQESSLLVLNSLFQLIDSSMSTFQSARQLSTYLDVLSAMIAEDHADEKSTEPAIVYEVKGSDDKEEDEDVMETDEDTKISRIFYPWSKISRIFYPL